MNTEAALSNAELALAAYASLQQGNTLDQRVALQAAGMTEKQAEEFARRYPTVFTQFNDTTTSFSATVFKDAAGNLTLAVRGTLEAGDFVPTDGHIALYGAAYDQIVSMVNWWRRVSTPANEPVRQFAIREFLTSPPPGAIELYAVGVSSYAYLVPAADDVGTGEVLAALTLDPDHRVDVTGHSLGSHLAVAFNGLIAGQVGQVTGFNVPGFIESATNQQFFAALGGAVPTESNSSNVINVKADEADVGQQPWSAVAGLHSRPGIDVDIAIENQWLSDEPQPRTGTWNHSQIVLTDSLSVYALLSQLDSALTTTDHKGLLSSAAAGTAASYERIVDALQSQLTADTAPLPAGNQAANREAMYQGIYGLRADARYQSLAGKIVIQPVVVGSTLATSARADFGDLVALKTLSPFILKPKSSDPEAPAALNAVWQAAHDADYSAWQNDATLTEQQRGNGAAAFTDSWYADRAAMLGWVLKANEQNIDYTNNSGRITGQPVREPTRFDDLQSQTAFTVSLQPLSQGALGVRRIVFGRDEQGDTISGADAGDRLYGGGRADTINAGAGNDYVEGNAGIDDLRGEGGDDILVGGADSDHLFGGADNDRLLGGQGSDTYYFNSSEGIDTIIDADGLGRVMWDNETLGGGLRLGDGLWRSADGRFTYSLSGQGAQETLVIAKQGSSGRILVEGFRRAAQDLSLILSDTPATFPRPAISLPLVGDLQTQDQDPAAPGTQVGLDSLGNERTNPVFEPGKPDRINDSAANDFIRPGTGNDQVVATRGGDDDIDAGAGTDIVNAGAGNDFVMGGSDGDLLSGGPGSDVIYGGAGDDLILPDEEFGSGEPVAGTVVPAGAWNAGSLNYTYRTYDGGDPRQGQMALLGYAVDGLSFYVLRGHSFPAAQLHDDPLARDFVDAGDGADTIWAGAGSDILLGGAGTDEIAGGGGDDILDGGSEGDILMGDANDRPANAVVGAAPIATHGSDVITGGAGQDLILGGGGSDQLFGGADGDRLYGDVSGYVIAGSGAVPQLESIALSAHGADLLDGGGGNDYLNGEGGNDLLIGSTGTDTLVGGRGDDTYRFSIGDSAIGAARDLIADVDGANVIEFGAGITMASLRFVPIPTSPAEVYFDRFAYGPNHEEVLLANGLWQGKYEFRFADGTRWSLDRMMAAQLPFPVAAATTTSDALNGGRNADRLIGDGAGDVHFSGGQGPDSLALLGGNNRVVFYAGDGADTVYSKGSTAARIDTIDLRDIAPGAVSVSKSGNDLRIQIANTADSLRVVDYYSGARHIQIQFGDGSLMDAAAIAAATGASPVAVNSIAGTTLDDSIAGTALNDVAHGLAGADVIDAGTGNDRISGDDGDDVLFGNAGDDDLTGGRGNDVLDGGTGNDVLRGGGDGFGPLMAGLDNTSWSTTQPGSDRYIFARGHGRDTVINGPNDADQDTLRLVGLSPQDVLFARSGSSGDLQIEIVGTDDALTVQGYFSGASGSVEWVEFDGGVKWNAAQVAANATHGSEGADVFLGTSGGDVFNARGGDDQVKGFEGDDTLIGGAGFDRIEGGSGADTIQGGDGPDQIFSNALGVFTTDGAADVVYGGAGNDYIQADAEDTVIGGPGDDQVYGGLAIFNAGDGADVISVPTVRFGAGILPSQVEVMRNGIGKVVLRIAGTEDSLTPDTWAPAPTRVEFADGTVWDWSNPTATFPRITGGTGADVIAGTALSEYILGNAGNDQISGGGSGDLLEGGDGNDTLNGDAGSDRLLGGNGNDTLNGGTGDDYLAGDLGVDVLAGGQGNDYYAIEPTGDTVTEAANEGDDTVAVASNDGSLYLTYTLAANLENLSLGASGRGVGNAAANRLTGSNFGDVLMGLSGNDIYAGGTASDYLVDNAVSDDLYRFAEYDGADVVSDAGGSDTLEFVDASTNTDAPDPARVRLFDAGDGLVISVARRDGYAPNNLILVDGMYQDFGVLAAGRALERITFADGTAWDLSTIQQKAADTTGYLIGGAASDSLTGTAGGDVLIGKAGADQLAGAEGDDVLLGGAGNDILDGGAGADQMAGGAGDDAYYVNSVDDLIVEAEGGGIDTVHGFGRLGANIERLVIATAGGGAGYGNELDNVLTGAAGNDTLDGGAGNDTLDGAAGADQLWGGSGNDTFHVDGNDTITERANEGTDTVVSSAFATLAGWSNVENLTLTGAANLNGTGNTMANTLRGNAGHNVLDGGTGADSLIGGAGDDTYIVDNASDTVTENANEGIDLVMSSVTRTLGSNQEHLTLTGNSSIGGTGNADANHLKGNSGNNTLRGEGGNDVLQGGAGNDTLTDNSGRGVHDGGDGTDTLIGGSDRQFFAGGAGNDTLTLGGGADVVAFNRGNGADTINAPSSGAGLNESNDTISLGGVRYGELRLARATNDLLIKIAGTSDSLRLKNWYASPGNRTVTTLQVTVDTTADYNGASTDRLMNKRVVRLDFAALVSAFNSAGSPTDWVIPAGTLDAAYLGGSDSQALGGNLAYRFAKDGNLAGLDFATVTAGLASTDFATAVQAFGFGATTGGIRLLRAGSTEAIVATGRAVAAPVDRVVMGWPESAAEGASARRGMHQAWLRTHDDLARNLEVGFVGEALGAAPSPSSRELHSPNGFWSVEPRQSGLSEQRRVLAQERLL